MNRHVTVLDPEAVDRVAAQTYHQWGGERDRDTHRARIGEQLSRGDGRLQYVGLVEGGDVLASLKRHRLALDTPKGTVDAVGIGALFTPPSLRGRGLSTTLLGEVLAEARTEACGAALLFSDVDPSFYERLGFVRLPSVTWSCPVRALPAQAALGRCVTDDLARLCAWRRRSYQGAWLRSHRTPASWRFGAWSNAAGPAHVIGSERAPRGYVVARRARDDVLWVDDAAADEPLILWACLGEMGRAVGARTVAGWLRADMVEGPFVAQVRSRCIPMLAPLDETTMAGLDSWRAHFSSLDHF